MEIFNHWLDYFDRRLLEFNLIFFTENIIILINLI